MRKIIIITFIGLFFVCSCAQDMTSSEKGDIDATRKVLIAGVVSEFKQDVVTKVIETLEPQDYYFKIIGLNQLEKEETEQYGAILLVNTYMAGKIDRRVTKFLQKDPTNPKVIIFYTIGGESNSPSKKAETDIKVDAVTSASLPNSIEKQAEQLVTLIEKRF